MVFMIIPYRVPAVILVVWLNIKIQIKKKKQTNTPRTTELPMRLILILYFEFWATIALFFQIYVFLLVFFYFDHWLKILQNFHTTPCERCEFSAFLFFFFFFKLAQNAVHRFWKQSEHRRTRPGFQQHLQVWILKIYFCYKNVQTHFEYCTLCIVSHWFLGSLGYI